MEPNNRSHPIPKSELKLLRLLRQFVLEIDFGVFEAVNTRKSSHNGFVCSFDAVCAWIPICTACNHIIDTVNLAVAALN